ncbi:MAG: class A beta-lactamase-related serine hydrolase [Anaerovibrio sp.]|uniref:serine hydrolase n=1 Tax=Anaerovibrio sp. TaxID=1872532 RepID=UPI0025D821D6|nr:serine hydrolase [Anaerovibrio sp.]MCR5175763.1 class A beta-lactamase-related serine hydrolase [Anaerovibrio sp.]
MKKLFSIVVIIAIIIMAGVYCTDVYRNTGTPPATKQPVGKTEGEQVREVQFDYGPLRNDIDGLLGDSGDEYSIFVLKGDDAGDPLIINNKVRRSASMIKVFIMAYLMDEVSHAKLNLNSTLTLKASDKVGGAGIISGWSTGTEISLDTLTRLMITESDNTATNMLIDYLGMDNINSYIRQKGYSDTVLQRKMMDLEAVSAGRENYTSVKDLGDFFTGLNNHSCVSYEYDQKMVDILLKQTDTEVFPAALPQVQIAHKTGELDHLYDDGGIIYTENGSYIVVVMNDGVARREAVSKMKRILQAANTRLNQT